MSYRKVIVPRRLEQNADDILRNRYLQSYGKNGLCYVQPVNNILQSFGFSLEDNAGNDERENARKLILKNIFETTTFDYLDSKDINERVANFLQKQLEVQELFPKRFDLQLTPGELQNIVDEYRGLVTLKDNLDRDLPLHREAEAQKKQRLYYGKSTFPMTAKDVYAFESFTKKSSEHNESKGGRRAHRTRRIRRTYKKHRTHRRKSCRKSYRKSRSHRKRR